MNSLKQILNFTKKYPINVTIEFIPEVNAYSVRFRERNNGVAMEVKFGQSLFEDDYEDLIAYALEKAENEMIKSTKSLEELIND